MFSESIRNNLLLNLVSEWKLDGDATDSWGNNNGINNGAVFIADESQCVSEGCASFSGDNNYISVAKNSTLDFSNQFTISWWWNKTTYDSVQIHFLKGDDWEDFNYYIYYSLGFFHLSVMNTESIPYSITYANTPISEKFNFYTFSNDGSHIKFYINGEEVDSSDSGSMLKTFPEKYLLIGTHNPGYLYPIRGKLDEIQIYNAAISETAIKQNYLSGLNNLYAKGLITELEYNEKLSEL
jgi:hypothetical protein